MEEASLLIRRNPDQANGRYPRSFSIVDLIFEFLFLCFWICLVLGAWILGFILCLVLGM